MHAGSYKYKKLRFYPSSESEKQSVYNTITGIVVYLEGYLYKIIEVMCNDTVVPFTGTVTLIR